MLNTLRTNTTINRINNLVTKDITIVPICNGRTNAFTIQSGNRYFIFIDFDLPEALFNSELYHEVGHCETDTVYTADTPVAERRKCERLAIRWAVQHSVPFGELVHALQNGVRDVYGISETFCISVDSAYKVLDYYKARVLDYMKLFYGEGVAI